MVTELTTDGAESTTPDGPAWGGAWDPMAPADPYDADRSADRVAPAWDARPPAPARRTFARVRRGYDADEVDAYLADLERRLAAAEAGPAPAPDLVSPERQAAAVELGTVLLDARDAAERIRADSERAAAQLVADAEDEARRILGEAGRRVNDEADRRRHDLEAEQRDAEAKTAQLRDSTTRVVAQISEWRGAALTALERVVAALEQWPGTVPDPASLDDVLGPARPVGDLG